MNFPSIEIQGSIISTEILSKIRSEQSTYQQGKDFNKDFTNSKLKDEISFAWQEAKGQWIIFQSKLSRLKSGQTGTTETRNFWIQPLLANLGYNLVFSKSSEETNGKQFPIGFKDTELNGFPVYIGSYFDSLDRPPQTKLLRTSPHAMLQEYLNYSEEQNYGLVTNGKQIRLLRDATRITRLSYVEFNLEKMMEEDLYSDFVIFYRLLHSSRMKKQFDDTAENIIEKYHQESLEAGSTIRSKLGIAVRQAIVSFGQEFINHPLNTSLREAIKENKVNIDEFYRHQLRIIYRLLFLFVIEERNLVFGESKSPELKRFSQIYFNYYSLLKLRKLAKNHLPPEANRNYDLWLGLLNTFALFEKKEVGEKLGIMSLEGDLFSYDAICSSSYDLHRCHLSNSILLRIIKSLTYFENENRVLIPVNYGGLDVEEFGSVYEGLLELKLNISKFEGSEEFSCSFETSSERSQSGSHYTPEELVQPLIKHSLEYLIEDRTQPYYQKKADKDKTIQSLLDLKVCDVACGSGHILLSAARRISLEVARIETDEEQPNPAATRKAMKTVVRNCIYGVDKNPLAVELCKVALWLEAHNPGEPLSFLDHHIKCGDSIVGLARRQELQNGIAYEAFKTLPGDDKVIAKTYRDKNVKERKSQQIELDYDKQISDEVKSVIEKYNLFKNLPERTPQEVSYKQSQFRKYEISVEHQRLKQLADAQVAQFFIPKTDSTKQYLLTDADYRDLLSSANKGLGIIQDRRLAYATPFAKEKNFFHWFLEFPEVMQEGGFDCILGNPPYLGGKKIRANFGDDFLNCLHSFYEGAGGQSDLITYFVRRIFTLIKFEKYFAIISTNTISQGDTRTGSLEHLIHNNGTINFVLNSTRWPGYASLFVSLFSVYKGLSYKKGCFIGNLKVSFINQFFEDQPLISSPEKLHQNLSLLFKGNDFAGDGFIITEEEKDELISKNLKNNEVIFKLFNGRDLNDSCLQLTDRYIINFFDWDIEQAKKYEEPFSIVEQRCKPHREKFEPVNSWNIFVREHWWLFGAYRVGLQNKLKSINNCFVTSVVTKYLNFTLFDTDVIFSNAIYVLALEEYYYYSILQSSMHNEWARKYSSSLETRLRYVTTDCFETFPFPQNLKEETEAELEKIGREYHEFRRQLMLDMQLGLTKTYNLFHNAECRIENVEKAKEIRDFKSAKLQIPIEDSIQRIEKLRALHKQMDEAVLKAYGWTDINLAHNFYEVDYLPENDRVRYTISQEARKEILKRLLELNHKIHAEEVAKGLWEKKTKKKGKTNSAVKEPKSNYGQEELF